MSDNIFSVYLSRISYKSDIKDIRTKYVTFGLKYSFNLQASRTFKNSKRLVKAA